MFFYRPNDVLVCGEGYHACALLFDVLRFSLTSSCSDAPEHMQVFEPRMSLRSRGA